MVILNGHPDRGRALEAVDVEMLGPRGTDRVARYLATRENSAATPLHTLSSLAAALGIKALDVKDEGFRLGLGSFKALGGAYAVAHLVREEAAKRLDRGVGFDDLPSPEVRAIAATMTFACATDGNHGRSVAQGAQLAGGRSAIFVHSGVSEGRVSAIAGFGAEVIRVAGTYDDSVAEAAEVADKRGWTIVSDTSWPGYERIPRLVMQGYTALVREALSCLPTPPTHVFLQAGVGGFAAAVAGHLAVVLGDKRPKLVVVEPARAACVFESARAGHPVKIAHGKATVMAMLECYAPSLVAWRILSRAADAFMVVDDEDAVAAMLRLARPAGGDLAIVAGESGGAGVAGLMRALRNDVTRLALDLDASSRVLVVNTEGATDPAVYQSLVGMTPADVLRQNARSGAVP